MSLQLVGGTVTNNGIYSTNTFTANGTVTVIGSGSVIVNLIAGGGGGGQGDTLTGGDNYGGGGGGSGGYYQNYALTLTAGTYNITIGAGGAPGAGGPIGGGAPWRGNFGGTGGTTSFASFLSATGGSGGYGGDGLNQGGGGYGGGGGSPNGSSGGGRGGDSSFVAGVGANSPFGTGGAANYNSGGLPGTGYGSGGSGGNASYSTSINNGGAGAPGFVSITYIPPPSIVNSEPGSNLTTTTALLNGQIVFVATILIQQGFDWGTTSSYGTSVVQSGNFNSVASFGATITGLTPGGTYHFRAKAYDGSNWFYGSDEVFTLPSTLPLAPTMTEQPATNIGSTSATLNGEISNANEADATQVGFDFGTTSLFGSSVTESGSFGTTTFSLGITSLTPSTSYYYRSKALNSVGWSYGPTQVFTTGAPGGSGNNSGHRVVCLGDGSSHGGTVVNTNNNGTFLVNNIPICVQGATHNCPIIGHGNTAITAITTMSYMNNQLILTYGAVAGCGAVIEPPDRQFYVE